MPRLVWDKVGERYYEAGVRNGVLYPYDNALKKYNEGVAWNGLTAVTESPTGAEENPQYADDIKYLAIRSIEEFGCTIEAYTYPDEFEKCDGTASLSEGIVIGQQPRNMFGFCYRTVMGNDVDYENHGYKIHVVYGCTASPSDKAYSTINESPEAITFSWEVTTTPVPVDGYRPTSFLTIDSTKVPAEKMALIEDALYGTEELAPGILMPDEIIELINEPITP